MESDLDRDPFSQMRASGCNQKSGDEPGPPVMQSSMFDRASELISMTHLRPDAVFNSHPLSGWSSGKVVLPMGKEIMPVRRCLRPIPPDRLRTGPDYLSNTYEILLQKCQRTNKTANLSNINPTLSRASLTSTLLPLYRKDYTIMGGEQFFSKL